MGREIRVKPQKPKGAWKSTEANRRYAVDRRKQGATLEEIQEELLKNHGLRVTCQAISYWIKKLAPELAMLSRAGRRGPTPKVCMTILYCPKHGYNDSCPSARRMLKALKAIPGPTVKVGSA